MLLKLSLTAPAPNNDAERKELTELASKLDGMYGKGKYCKPVDGKEKCLSLNDLERIMATARIRTSCWMPGWGGTRFLCR